MSEEKVVNILNSLGLDHVNISDDDYNVYADYFTEKALSSDDESSDGEESQELEANGSCLNSSLLKSIPKLDELSVSNTDNLIDIDDVIIQIEANGDDQQLVDVNDVVVVNEVEDDYNPDPDHILVTNFLESGCGCKENCCSVFSADELLHRYAIRMCRNQPLP